MPKISVIMPAYNAEKYIAEAIRSVLNQSFRDFELIVLNDCSVDRTEGIIRSFDDERIVYLKNEKNLGVAATLNRGLEHARGEYIARMDADDISLPDRFEMQAAYLDTHRDIGVLGCAIEIFDETGVRETRSFSADPKQMRVDLFFSSGLAHPSVMMRKNVILELDGYEREFEGLEDYRLWCRVSEKCGVSALPERLFRYRVHGGQVTQNPSAKHRARMEALRIWQLGQLGLPEELRHRVWRAYPAVTKEEILEQAAGFRAVLDANETAGLYDGPLLEKAFRGILLTAAAELSGGDRKALCAGTDLIDPVRLARCRLIRKVRRALGR